MANDSKEIEAIIGELEKIRGRHTELVTVYIPAGVNLAKVVEQVRSEQSTAVNIKSKAVRKNVLAALEKILQHLRFYKETPDNGLAIFCGNVSETEGNVDIEIWAIEPPEPVKVRLYRCDQTFILDPLKDMTREKEVYGLILVDKSDAAIGLLVGKRIDMLKEMDSIVPGKTSKGGWCVHEDALIQLSDGRIVKIKDLKEDRFICYDFGKLNPVIGKHNHYFARQAQAAYRIRTKAPTIEITVTPEHKFFVPDKAGFAEKSAEELRAGDRLLALKKMDVDTSTQPINADVPYSLKVTQEGRGLLVRRRAELGLSQKSVARKLGVSQTMISKFELGERDFAEENLMRLLHLYGLGKKTADITHKDAVKFPTAVTKDFARFLGYFTGDGSVEDNRITLNDSDENLLENYGKIAESLFGIKNHVKARAGRNYSELRIHSKEIVSLLKSTFGNVFRASPREIPDAIFMSPNSVLASYISGLWDAEGYVVRSNKSLGITMTEEHIIRRLQMLLLRFGIMSSVKRVEKKNSFAKGYRYALVITDGKSMSRFSSEIPLLSEKKFRILHDIMGETRNLSYTDQVPVAGSFILSLIRRIGMTTNDFPKVQDFFFDKKGMSYPVFCRNIIPIIEKKAGHGNARGVLPLLKRITESGLISARIKSIERINATGKFYDLEVPVYGNFMANGIIVHNSQARYQRIREGLLNDFLKQVGDIATQKFSELKDLKGIIIGGPGPIKEGFADGEFLHYMLKKKLLGVVNTSYTGAYGLKEMVDKSEDILKEAAVMREKKILDRFFEEFAKDSGMAIYGVAEVLHALQTGNLEIVLLSEKFDYTRIIYSCSCGHKEEKIIREGKLEHKCDRCGNTMKLEEEHMLKDEIIRLANGLSTKVEFISVHTPKGEQLKELGGIAGMLRYRVRG
ncbi:MAG: helix-turn-helix domain-containing protein [Candidatus Aenigmarchaeota archaeon]|nr:helix-turn-helix domain-containing protein [Candidatus Aenigmarchaeota archaeon]